MILQKELETLQEQLRDLDTQTQKTAQNPGKDTLYEVRSVYDILISDSYSYIQKSEALRQIIKKIIYNKEENSLKIYYFLLK